MPDSTEPNWIDVASIDVTSIDVNGSVVAFEEHRGLGTVRDTAGREFPFHCVEIADGSRRIAVGTAVRFGLRRKLGRREAVTIRHLEPGSVPK